MDAPRVVVFIDYENASRGGHEQFWPPGTPRNCTHFNPTKVSQLLVDRREGGGHLTDVRIYRGRPEPRKEPEAAAATDRQANAWLSQGCTVIRRPLKYYRGWPDVPPQEKGIDVKLAIDVVRLAYEGKFDVGIVFSCDTDLAPCLETVSELDMAHVETACWDGSTQLRTTGAAV